MSNPDSSEILKTIRAGAPKALLELSPQQTADVAAADPKVFAQALRGVARRCTPGVEPKRQETAPILAFLDRLAPLASADCVDYLRSTADFYEGLAGEDIPSTLSSGRIDDLLHIVDDRVAAHSERHNGEGSDLARENVLGKIHSLNSRDVAQSHFGRLRSEDRGGIIPDFYVDLGAMTYFAQREVEREASLRDAQQIRSAVHELGERKSANSTSIVVSVDPRFYRIYAPYLYFCAQQLPEIDVTLVICGTGGQAKELIGDGHRYMKALAGLNGSGYPQNLNHYFMPVPKFAIERRTFYAGARFFAASTLLERYANLYLMDADLVVDVHPGAFLKKVRSLPVAVPKSAGPAALSPWRRYMAGNIPLNQEILNTSFLEDTQRYLAHGFRSRSSWMLDQNALSYAIERSSRAIEDVNGYPRPIRTMKFMATWEKNYRRKSG